MRVSVAAGGVGGLPQLTLGETWILVIVIGLGTARVEDPHQENARCLVQKGLLVSVPGLLHVFQGTLKGARVIMSMHPGDAAAARTMGVPFASMVQLRR